MKNALAFAALASCLSATGRAASPPPLPESLLACTKLQDVNERVGCYDTQIAAIVAASGGAVPAPPKAGSQSAPSTATPGASAATAPAPRTVPATTVAGAAQPGGAATSSARAPAQSAEAQFGREQLPASARPQSHEQAPVLSSSITAMRLVGPQTYQISLANGQIWRQEGTQTTSSFRVGDDVHIRKGTLGSYHMWTDKVGEKNWVRVTRVQ